MPRKCLVKAEKRVRVTDETFSKWRLQRDSLGFTYDDEYAQYLLRVGESLQKINMLDKKEGSTSADADLELRTVEESHDVNRPAELATDDMVQSGDEAKSDNGDSGPPGVSQTSIKAFKRTLAPPKEAQNNDSDYSARKLDLGWCTAEYDRQQVLSGITDQKRFIAHLLNSHNQWCSTCRTSSATLTASTLAQDKSDFAASNPELKIPTSWESKKWFEDLNAHSNMSITSFLLHLLLIYSHWHSIPLPGQNKAVGKGKNATDDTVTMVTREVASTSESILTSSMFVETGESTRRAKKTKSRRQAPARAKSDFVHLDSFEAIRSGATDADPSAIPGMTDLSSSQAMETDKFLEDELAGNGSISTTGKNVPMHPSELSGANYPGGHDLGIKSEQLEAVGEPIRNVPDGCKNLNAFDHSRYLGQVSVNNFYQTESFAVPASDIIGVGESSGSRRSSKSRARHKATKSFEGFESGEELDFDDQNDKDWDVAGFEDSPSSCSDMDLANIVPVGDFSSQGQKQTDGMDRTDHSSSDLSRSQEDIDQNEAEMCQSSKMPGGDASESETQMKKEGALDAVKNKITCTLCLKTFVTQSKHAGHMKWHDKVPTKCRDCDFTIDPEMKTINNCRVAMAIHRRKHHTTANMTPNITPDTKYERTTKCPICDYTVVIHKRAMIETHMKIAHPEIMRGDLDGLVNEKGQATGSFVALEDDTTKSVAENVGELCSSGTNNDDGGFHCKLCSKHFPTVRKYKSHLGLHMRAYHCQYCDFHLDPDQVSLNDCFVTMSNHRKEKHPEHFQKYLCDICGRGLVTPGSLRQHKVDVHKVRSATMERQCPNCDAVLPSRSALKTHQSRFHPLQLTCDYANCGKVFSCRVGLTMHKNVVHPAVRKHPCKVEGCKARFPTSMRLKTHIAQKHERQRNFPCDFGDCGKMFFSSYNLRVHQRVHFNEKPLKCPHCDYRAAQRNSMNWHMKKHMI